MKKLFLLVLLCILFEITFAQTKTIFGAVISADHGRPVPGVKVIWLEVKMKAKTHELVFVESKVKTKTNEKGEYMLDITNFQENKIRFRKEGYKTIEIDVGNRTRIDLAIELEKKPD